MGDEPTCQRGSVRKSGDRQYLNFGAIVDGHAELSLSTESVSGDPWYVILEVFF